MKKLILLSLSFMIYIPSFAQAPDTLWTRVLDVSTFDNGQSVQQTMDGGFIICGYTYLSGLSYDIWLIKTNSSGDILWTKTFDDGGDEKGYSVQQTLDEGYIITGYKAGSGPQTAAIWLIKTNQSGDTLWTKSFGGDNYDIGYSVQQTPDEGYIIAGVRDSGACLIRTDTFGDTIWTKNYPNSLNVGNSVDQTSDGGYIITGYFNDGTDWKIGLIKTDSQGDTLWTKTYFYGLGRSVQQTTDEGYIITGADQSKLCLVKTDSAGKIKWIKTYSNYNFSLGNSVQQTTDSGYIIAGAKSYNAFYYDLWIIKTNSTGDTLWTRPFENNHWLSSVGYSIKQTTDGGYIVTGYKGMAFPFTNLFLIRLEADSVTNVNMEIVPSQFGMLQNFPNPFNSSSTIRYSIPRLSRVTIRIFDILGNEIETLVNEEKPAGSYSVKFDGSKYSSGIYFYQMKAGNYTATKKLVLLK